MIVKIKLLYESGEEWTAFFGNPISKWYKDFYDFCARLNSPIEIKEVKVSKEKWSLNINSKILFYDNKGIAQIAEKTFYKAKYDYLLFKNNRILDNLMTVQKVFTILKSDIDLKNTDMENLYDIRVFIEKNKHFFEQISENIIHNK